MHNKYSIVYSVIYVNILVSYLSINVFAFTCDGRYKHLFSTDGTDMISPFTNDTIPSVYKSGATTASRIGVQIPRFCVDGRPVSAIKSIDFVEAIVDIHTGTQSAVQTKNIKFDVIMVTGNDPFIEHFSVKNLGTGTGFNSRCFLENITSVTDIDTINYPGVFGVLLTCDVTNIMVLNPVYTWPETSKVWIVITANFDDSLNEPPNSRGLQIRRMHPQNYPPIPEGESDFIWKNDSATDAYKKIPNIPVAISISFTGITNDSPAPPPTSPTPIANIPNTPTTTTSPPPEPISNTPTPTQTPSVTNSTTTTATTEPITEQNPNTSTTGSSSPINSPYNIPETQPNNTPYQSTTGNPIGLPTTETTNPGPYINNPNNTGSTGMVPDYNNTNPTMVDGSGNLKDNFSGIDKNTLISVLVICSLLVITFIIIAVVFIRRWLLVRSWRREYGNNQNTKMDIAGTIVDTSKKFSLPITQIPPPPITNNDSVNNQDKSNNNNANDQEMVVVTHITNRHKQYKSLYNANSIVSVDPVLQNNDKNLPRTIPKPPPSNKIKLIPPKIPERRYSDNEMQLIKAVVDSDNEKDPNTEGNTSGDEYSGSETPLLINSISNNNSSNTFYANDIVTNSGNELSEEDIIEEVDEEESKKDN